MLPGSHLYPLCLSPRQTAKGPMEMHPVPLVSLCPRSLSGCGSINLRQEGKHKIEINNSGATFNTRRTRAGGHIPELLLPPRDNFHLCVTQWPRGSSAELSPMRVFCSFIGFLSSFLFFPDSLNVLPRIYCQIIYLHQKFYLRVCIWGNLK